MTDTVTHGHESGDWLPLPGRARPDQVMAIVNNSSLSELAARRRNSGAYRRVLRALVHHQELVDLLSRAGFRSGAHVLYWGCGPADQIAALLDLDVAHVTAIDRRPEVLAEARRRWRPHPRQEAMTFGVVDAGSTDLGSGRYWDGVLVQGVVTAGELAMLRERVRPGGIVAIEARPPSPDTTYSWDRSLQARVNAALAAHPDSDTGALAGATAQAMLASCGSWAQLRAVTVVVERYAPLPDLVSEQVTQDFALAAAYPLRRCLGPEDRAVLADLYNPATPAYLVRRPDLHLLQPRTLVWGRLPGF